MSLKSVEYICPTIILVITFLLKFTVDERVSWKNFKRLFVETSVDVMSLAISFVISFLIASAARVASADPSSGMWEEFSKGIIVLIVYILALIITVLCSKYSIRKYSETEKLRFWFLGIIVGYAISLFSLSYSIALLRGLGGA